MKIIEVFFPFSEYKIMTLDYPVSYYTHLLRHADGPAI